MVAAAATTTTKTTTPPATIKATLVAKATTDVIVHEHLVQFGNEKFFVTLLCEQAADLQVSLRSLQLADERVFTWQKRESANTRKSLYCLHKIPRSPPPSPPALVVNLPRFFAPSLLLVVTFSWFKFGTSMQAGDNWPSYLVQRSPAKSDQKIGPCEQQHRIMLLAK